MQELAIDINALTPEQRLILAKQLEEKRVEDRANLIKQLRTDIAAHIEAVGLTVNDVFPSLGSLTKKIKPPREVAVKYRNPENPDQTWTGLGRQPRWLAKELETGRDLDYFLIGAQEPASFEDTAAADVKNEEVHAKHHEAVEHAA